MLGGGMARILFALLLVVAVANTAHSGPLTWFKKASKGGSGAASVGASQLSKTELRAAAAVLGVPVLVEVHQGKILMEVGQAASELVGESVDDIGKLASKARSLVDPSPSKPTRFALTRESAAELGSDLGKLLPEGEVFVVEPLVGPMRVVAHGTNSLKHYYKQLEAGLIMPVEARITEAVVDTLAMPVRREQMRVASMFAPTDVDSISKLATAAGDRLLSSQALAPEHIERTLEKMRGGVLLVTGHVEQRAFVARGARGEAIASLDISDLEKLAAKADVRVVSAGCLSSCAGARAGFADKVTDVEMAEAVRAAFDADTTKGMLAAFGKHHPLVVNQQVLDDFAESRRLHLDQLRIGTSAVLPSAVAVRFFVPLRPSSALLTMLETVGVWYGVGFVSMLLLYRTSRAAFLRTFPKLPSPSLPGKRLPYVAARIGRLVLYILLSPFFSLITAFFVGIFFWNGWGKREAFQAGLWRCVRRPLAGVGALVFYGVGLTVLIGGGIELIGLALVRIDSPLFWPLIVASLAYWVVAVWGGRKASRAFLKWFNGQDLMKVGADVRRSA